ncbi:EthD family reductase [Pelagibius sp.]|uniref:EthD family reductase n=1 Tax=Pelagibius sp. TaxID=1931238 RepID=UPI003B50AB56
MIKAVELLKRKDELSADAFADWLLKEHLPMVLKLPGLRRYQANIAADPEDDFDGFSELWFDSEEAMLSAYSTDLGKAVAADSLAHVKLRKRFVVREHPFEPPFPSEA